MTRFARSNATSSNRLGSVESFARLRRSEVLEMKTEQSDVFSFTTSEKHVFYLHSFLRDISKLPHYYTIFFPYRSTGT